MHPLFRGLLAVGGGLLGLWIGWGTYVRRTTERVPYETVDSSDGIEIRRYPETVLVETTAPDERTAFRRLVRYLKGANEGSETVEMTAPVASRDDGGTVDGAGSESEGAEVSMTAPVRTDSDGDDVRMAFYLPEEYTAESAPRPTDPEVELAVEEPRTVAVRSFSWFATDRRVARQRERLLDALAERGVQPDGEPSLLRYNDPRTPPFMRRNEVAVPVARPADGPTARRRPAGPGDHGSTGDG
jgi:hypothetical protein